MSLPDTRWHVMAESEYPWEREALEWLRAQLPDAEPWHVWTNFEFIDDLGKVNEIDALVIAPTGLFLVEIKSRPGSVRGDTHTWTWTTDGRERSVDNPLLLANRKAKRLAGLLRKQPAIIKGKRGLPRVEALIFLSDPKMDCRLEGRARTAVHTRYQPGSDAVDIIKAMAPDPNAPPQQHVDRLFARTIARAVNEAGIRPSNRRRQVGDYQLHKLITDGDAHQEWLARHVSVGVERRIRIYNLAKATNPEERDNRVRQAQREFRMLEGIDHPGILRCREYKECELGPALIFDHDPKAVRLDHLIRDRAASLGISQRLHLVRAIAETLRYAHSRGLYHRALSPRSVLVRDIESAEPRIQLMNWQTGARPGGETDSSTRTQLRTAGTLHVDAYVEDPDRVYLAPELTTADAANSAPLDVFSLGCLAHLIFSGQPPAANIVELNERLRAGPGLRLADVHNGCSEKLNELIQFATCPDLVTRHETIRDFLGDLDKVEEELTTPDPETTVDPSQAGPNSRIEGGFTVVRRLGRGSSSDALLVKRDGSHDEHVLKIAVDAAHNDNLTAEAEALAKLTHANIVTLREVLTVRGRKALLLRSAGNQTLAQLLRQDGRLSLEMLQRYGEELLDAVRHLEDSAVVHRDIKPENIGIVESRTGKLRLCLFDFSLCGTPPENIGAGTPPYLDPFLETRSHRRWDLYAERFAAAVTLYQMATGHPPKWGDGRSAPHLLDVEVTIEQEALPSAVREPLAQFFAKALRRDFRQRHDNAEDLLRAWRAAFDLRGGLAPEPLDDFATRAPTFTAATTMAELGYSREAQDVLERLGLPDVERLLGMDRIKFRYLRGVGDRIRREIRLKAKLLAGLRPDLAKGRAALISSEDGPAAEDDLPATLDEIADHLLPQRSGALDANEQTAVRHYLGLDGNTLTWPSIGDTAAATRQDRAAVTGAVVKARERWRKSIRPLNEVREELGRLLVTQGQVMTLAEAAQALLVMRHSALGDEHQRLRTAGAVLRAAIEAEHQLEHPRFDAYRVAGQPLIATAPEWADYAGRLGAAADQCASADPLLSDARAREALLAVALPAPDTLTGDGTPAPEITPPAEARLLRLATAASTRAALSSRLEIYPRGLSPTRALRAALDSIVGPGKLTVEALTRRVLGRFPEGSPLPPRPDLDRLLDDAGVPLVWDPTAEQGQGAYGRPQAPNAYTSGTTTAFKTDTPPPRATPADIDSAGIAREAVDERLSRQFERGGLLLLTTEVRRARHVEAELLQRFGPASPHQPALSRISLDQLLLDALRREAASLKVDWATVLQADNAPQGSRDWTNLNRLVGRALPALRAALLDSPVPLLAVHAGLLARYDLLSLIPELEQTVGRPGRTPALWLLLPTPRSGAALIDGAVVPMVETRNVLALDGHWLSAAAAQAAVA